MAGIILVGVAGIVVGCVLGIAFGDSEAVMFKRARHYKGVADDEMRRRKLAESERDDLRHMCQDLRWMLESHPNRCEMCDEVCPFDDTCVLDGRLESLGVCVPEPRTGFVSQCAEEDE